MRGRRMFIAVDPPTEVAARVRTIVDRLRLAGAEAVGEHKTSMLQDIEAKRPTEVAALVGSIIELGRLVEVPTPAICAVYACVRLLENTLAQAP